MTLRPVTLRPVPGTGFGGGPRTGQVLSAVFVWTKKPWETASGDTGTAT